MGCFWAGEGRIGGGLGYGGRIDGGSAHQIPNPLLGLRALHRLLGFGSVE